MNKLTYPEVTFTEEYKKGRADGIKNTKDVLREKFIKKLKEKTFVCDRSFKFDNEKKIVILWEDLEELLSEEEKA